MNTYIGWHRVPKGLNCKNGWEHKNRRVNAKQRPCAEVQLPQMRRRNKWSPDRAEGTTDQLTLDSKVVSLYSREQTRPITPSSLECAHRQYYEIFVGPLRKDRYIWQAEEWRFCYGFLSRSKVRSHITMKSEYGVLAGSDGEFNKTRFEAIDLDFHWGDIGVYIDQLRVLLTEFQGDGWHVQVREHEARGIHLLHVIPESLLGTVQDRLRARLKRLDDHHPDLVKRAFANNMKPLGDVEIYPDLSNGFRLPLAKGRTMLLDKPLALIENRPGHPVQDVAGYMKWIGDKDRTHMSVDEIIDYVEKRLVINADSELQINRRDDGTSLQAISDDLAVVRPRATDIRRPNEDWVQMLVRLATNGLPGPDTVSDVVYELAKWLLHVEFAHLDLVTRQAKAFELLTTYLVNKHNSYVSRFTIGNYEEVHCQVRRIVNKATSISETNARKLQNIRESQDAGKYVKMVKLEPLIVGDNDGGSLISLLPPPTRSIYIGLQVLKERGLLDRQLPQEVIKALAAVKGRQRIDLFARRFLNALYASPKHRRLISYDDVYRMMDKDLNKDTAKPTTANQYLRTLKRAGLIRVSKCYIKGTRAMEYEMEAHIVECFDAEHRSCQPLTV